MYFWKSDLAEDAEVFWDYLQVWGASPETFWNSEKIITLRESKKIGLCVKTALHLHQVYSSKVLHGKTYGIDKVSLFKKAAFLVKGFHETRPFHPEIEWTALSEDEQKDVIICNYRCAWDIACAMLYEGIIPGDKGKFFPIKNLPKIPSIHLTFEILEHNNGDVLSDKAIALILELITYISNPEIIGARDILTQQPGQADPNFIMWGNATPPPSVQIQTV